eukprot:g22768.t1
MPCCAKRRAVRHTPLEQYAKSLEVQEAAIEADPLELFPMYVVPLDVLLDMTQVVPHENLKTEGKLLEYEESMGNAAFSNLSKAIDSIPAYVGRCSFFFALCPVLEDPTGDRFHSFLDSSEGLQSGGAGGARPLLVARFLYQNGFRSVHETDSAGWSPLHYASLRGSPALIQGLLSLRADPNRLTKQDQPRVGLPPMTSPLTICVCFKHNQAARQLIAARAKIDGGLLKPLEFASVGDNPEGVRLLCEAGSSVHSRSIMGFTALEIACCRGAMAAMLEIARQAGENMDLSGALWCALALKAEGGTAGIVEWLLDRRADVNQTGATPLVMAMIESQYEGAATLIAAGARLDLPNARSCCAADFIREQAVPDFLAQAVEGNLQECRRVSALAQSQGHVEQSF